MQSDNDSTIKSPSFSKRELEVLMLLAEGMDSEMIGERLHVSPLTIRTHRRNMQMRNQCRNTAALISFSFRRGIIK